jgi:phage anti-repressor protein
VTDEEMVAEGILDRGSADAGTSPVGFDGILVVKDRLVGGRMVSTVDARELHARLGVRDHFTSWLDGKQAQLRLQSGVDYIEDRFLSEGMSRAARQCFLTEHAARGIVALDGRKEARAMRERLFGRAEASDRNTEVEPADDALASVDPVDFEAEVADRRHGKLDDVSSVGGADQVDPTTGEYILQSVEFGSSFRFDFKGRQVRAIVVKGDWWFVAADVCAVLDLADPHVAVRRLEPLEKGRFTIPTRGGPQEAILVSESGLWALVFTSRKPEAKAFRFWITSEVLPTLRKAGGLEGRSLQPTEPKGLVEPRFFAAPSGWEAATVPMRMCEFLRSIGVPDEAVEAEAPVRERELRLASLGTGRVSGFFRLGTDAWVFHRSVLDAWWAAAGRDVVASILRRQLT